MKMTAAEFLKKRGWNYTNIAGTTDRRWFGPMNDEAWTDIVEALNVQLARDAEEERRVVGDAIANAASRHCKADESVVSSLMQRAADLALVHWRRCYAVEICPDATEPAA